MPHSNSSSTVQRFGGKSAEGQTVLSSVDPIWAQLRDVAEKVAVEEPILASFVHATILKHDRLEEALSYHMAQKLGGAELSNMLVREVFEDVLASRPELGDAVRADLTAVLDRDPACKHALQPFLYFKGFLALQTHRVAHHLWNDDREWLALNFQSRMSELFAVDIHPAAKIGQGIMFDHAHSIVVGETAVIEDNVSLLHEVTLGGTGKEDGDRHPKIRKGVLIGAGAKILGNIEVGECARVASGSVVLADVPAHCTVAGVPAKVVGCAGCDQPAQAMEHRIQDNAAGDITGDSTAK